MIEKIENYINGYEINYNDFLNSKLIVEIKPSLTRMDKKSKIYIYIYICIFINIL